MSTPVPWPRASVTRDQEVPHPAFHLRPGPVLYLAHLVISHTPKTWTTPHYEPTVPEPVRSLEQIHKRLGLLAYGAPLPRPSRRGPESDAGPETACPEVQSIPRQNAQQSAGSVGGPVSVGAIPSPDWEPFVRERPETCAHSSLCFQTGGGEDEEAMYRKRLGDRHVKTHRAHDGPVPTVRLSLRRESKRIRPCIPYSDRDPS